jgi:hypothetical protein
VSAVADVHDGIAALLAGDATFVAELQALGLGLNGEAVTPGVVRSFRPLASLGQEVYPSWVLEPGDAASAGQAVGSCHQDFQSEVLLGLVWHQQDPDTAYRQRLALLDALVRLFLRNPLVADSPVTVDAQGNDRAANHPTHITTFRLLAELTIAK